MEIISVNGQLLPSWHTAYFLCSLSSFLWWTGQQAQFLYNSTQLPKISLEQKQKIYSYNTSFSTCLTVIILLYAAVSLELKSYYTTEEINFRSIYSSLLSNGYYFILKKVRFIEGCRSFECSSSVCHLYGLSIDFQFKWIFNWTFSNRHAK